jgi:hypothetical protein
MINSVILDSVSEVRSLQVATQLGGCGPLPASVSQTLFLPLSSPPSLSFRFCCILYQQTLSRSGCWSPTSTSPWPIDLPSGHRVSTRSQLYCQFAAVHVVVATTRDGLATAGRQQDPPPSSNPCSIMRHVSHDIWSRSIALSDGFRPMVLQSSSDNLPVCVYSNLLDEASQA